MRGLSGGEGCADGSFKLLPADGGYVAEGEARLPRRGGEPADVVVLARGTTGEEQTAFALAGVGAPGARDDATWRKALPPGILSPDPPTNVTAWAFDAEEGRAYRLCGDDAAGLPR
jgi:hypothetical protein